jgi:hypothetical protein
MYCPECGDEAEDAKFCPECGADLRGLASDPTCGACGSEVPDGAKFCPECGETTGLRPDDDPGADATRSTGADAAGAPTTGARGRNAGGTRQQQRQQQRRQQRRAPQKNRPQPESRQTAAGPSTRLSPAVIWGGFGIMAVVVILVVVFAAGGGAADSPGTAAPTGGAQTVQPVSADTSGSYDELVQRANGLYDEGAAAVQASAFDQGAAYFEAAAKVYAAAWQKQSTNPNVGTDFATSLFYSGQIEPALRQIERVLTQSPTFQTGWFNKGNYLIEKALHAEQDGDAETAEAATADARVAFEKAVSLGAGTPSGQQAQQRLDEMVQ